MIKDLEYYKKQGKVFERRIDLLKKEVDKLIIDNNKLKEQFVITDVVKCKHEWKIGNIRSRIPNLRCKKCGKRKFV